MNSTRLADRAARDDDHLDHNASGNPVFQSVLDARLSRRSVLRGGVGSAATALLGGWGLAACGGGDDDPVAPPISSLAFSPAPTACGSARRPACAGSRPTTAPTPMPPTA